ncbi:MAG: hypothetical protein ACI39W_06300 [Brotaphodocola sp.]
MKKSHKDGAWITGCVLSLIFFGAVISLFLKGVESFEVRMEQEGAETLRSAISRACIQCYAIEGRYPPNVQYLEDEYGIRIDEERYHVFYSGFASNVMPDITVIPVEHDRVSGR